MTYYIDLEKAAKQVLSKELRDAFEDCVRKLQPTTLILKRYPEDDSPSVAGKYKNGDVEVMWRGFQMGYQFYQDETECENSDASMLEILRKNNPHSSQEDLEKLVRNLNAMYDDA
jgi:hypothetical protein